GEPTKLPVLANSPKVPPPSGGPQALRRAVMRIQARVTSTAVTPTTTTARTANSGSPTRPGPWPELRGSPASAPGVGVAASAVVAIASHTAAVASAPDRRPTFTAPLPRSP